jgi:hypothetical protein
MGVNTKALFLAAVAFLASAAAPANAGGNPPEFDPDRIEFATPTSQSSDCFGDLRTLICAAETRIICSVLEWRHDCAGIQFLRRAWNPDRHERLEYKIIAAGTISRQRYAAFARAHAEELKYGPTSYGWVRPGVGQIRFLERTCDGTLPSCDGVEWSDTMLVFEFANGVWIDRNGMSFLPEDWFID